MKVIVKKKLGTAELTFQIEEPKDIDALAKAACYNSIPEACSLCKSENLRLELRKADNFTFISVRCLACSATANMGQHKDNSGTIFWKAFEKYNSQGQGQDVAPVAPSKSAATPIKSDDEPF